MHYRSAIARVILLAGDCLPEQPFGPDSRLTCTAASLTMRIRQLAPMMITPLLESLSVSLDLLLPMIALRRVLKQDEHILRPSTTPALGKTRSSLPLCLGSIQMCG